MNFDNKITNNELTIYCPDSLKSFSDDFIKHYNNNINDVNKILGIKERNKC